MRHHAWRKKVGREGLQNARYGYATSSTDVDRHFRFHDTAMERVRVQRNRSVNEASEMQMYTTS